MRPTPPWLLGQFLVGIDAKLLVGDVVAGQLAESELVGVVADALKAEAAAQRFESKGCSSARARR